MHGAGRVNWQTSLRVSALQNSRFLVFKIIQLELQLLLFDLVKDCED